MPGEKNQDIRDDEDILKDIDVDDLDAFFEEMDEEGAEGGEATSDETKKKEEKEEKKNREFDDEENMSYEDE